MTAEEIFIEIMSMFVGCEDHPDCDPETLQQDVIEKLKAYARHVAEKREADLLEWFDGANSDTWAYAGLQIDRNQIETP